MSKVIPKDVEIVKPFEFARTTYVVAIPKLVREKIGLKKGQRFFIYVDDGKIVLEPITG
jgi:AbrB family looped-hinge helix DNA binding protein